MRKILLSSLALLLVFGVLQTAARSQTDEQVRQVLAERLAAGKQAAGATVAVVNEKGVHFIAQGETSVASPNTVYEIGSVSKVFTATLLAEAVKRGEVGLDDPAQKYLPANVKVPSKNNKQITLRQLAGHTSGLPRLPGNFKITNPSNPYADYAIEQLYDFLSSYELPREPGAQYEYSNLGSGLLGHILSLRAKTSFENLIKTRILEPLNMKNTAVTLTPAMRAKLALGHNALGEAAGNWDIPTLAGAGALRSTAEDMIIFAAANAGLQNSKLAQVFAATQNAQRNPTTIPNTEITLGWHILNGNGKEVFWHNGQTGGYHSFVGFDRTGKKAVVILASMATELDDIGFALLGARTLPKTIKIAPKILDSYTGEYQLAPNFILTVTRDGDYLFVQATGQKRLQIFAASENEFYNRVVEAQIKFVKNETGAISGLTFDQKGRRIQAQKIK